MADGSQWAILGADELAVAAVSGLGEVMCLRPGVAGRELYAAVCRDRMHDTQKLGRNGAVVCWLPPPLNRDLEVIQMERIAASIALQSLPLGGLLLHGALAEFRGAGYMMAGPSGVGKSTASRRLPPPHRSLCDDRTLVVRDRAGRYWAHPWPTWSRLQSGVSGSWQVEKAVPLRGIFFLSQSPLEGLQSADCTYSTAMIMESAIDLVRTVTRLSEAGGSSRLWKDHLSAAKALAAAVPVYSLKLSLHGGFWKEIEQVMSEVGETENYPAQPDHAQASPNLFRFRASAHNSGPSLPEACYGRLRAVCLGRAMAPTLAEADILEVEPYGRRSVRPGDVVSFKSPDNAETVVRRVASVERRGTMDEGPVDVIRTRGDDNRQPDPWFLRFSDIAGRVVAARRGFRRRPISGGLRGRVEAILLSGRRSFQAFSRPIRERLTETSAAAALGDILSRYFRFRLVEFAGRDWIDLKLLSAEREIGRYDCVVQTWRIRQPHHLFVDLGRLPTPTIWTRLSFARASLPRLHPRESGVSPTEPETFSRVGYRGFENSALTDLSASLPSPRDVCLEVATMVKD